MNLQTQLSSYTALHQTNIPQETIIMFVKNLTLRCHWKSKRNFNKLAKTGPQLITIKVSQKPKNQLFFYNQGKRHQHDLHYHTPSRT